MDPNEEEAIQKAFESESSRVEPEIASWIHQDKQQMLTQAQQVMGILEDWSRKWDIQFSPQKSEIWPVNYFPDPADHVVTLYETPLQMVEPFVYLGTKINSQLLSWKEEFDRRLKSGRKILTRFVAAAGKTWGPSVRMQLWLLNFVIMQHTGYGSAIYHRFLKSS